MPNNVITSLKDERIQSAKELSTLKGRLLSGKILIEGLKAITWATQSGIEIDYILASSTSSIRFDENLSTKYFLVSDGLLKKVTGTKYLIPEVAIAQIKYNSKFKDFIVVIDNIQDYGNLGTITRTCHAFGIDTLISTNVVMDLYQKKIIDASRGKVFSTKLIKFDNPTDTIQYLKRNDFQIVTTSPHGNTIQSMSKLTDKPIALIIGNETDGVSGEFLENADSIIQIPMQSHVESLNVGVAAGISIYELKLKQVIGMIENKIRATLGREINVTSMLIQKVFDKKLNEISQLSSTQLIFMMVLKCDVVMNIENIKRQFGLLDDDVDDFFKPLVENNFIDMKQNPEILITEIGIETIGKFWPIIENTEAEILRSFSNEEMDIFKTLLNKMKDTCIEILDKK